MDKGKVAMNPVSLATFHTNKDNWKMEYILATNDMKVDTEAPMLLVIPVGLVECMLATQQTPWELYGKIRRLITAAAGKPGTTKAHHISRLVSEGMPTQDGGHGCSNILVLHHNHPPRG